jgi:hypothetical protein
VNTFVQLVQNVGWKEYASGMNRVKEFCCFKKGQTRNRHVNEGIQTERKTTTNYCSVTMTLTVIGEVAVAMHPQPFPPPHSQLQFPALQFAIVMRPLYREARRSILSLPGHTIH